MLNEHTNVEVPSQNEITITPSCTNLHFILPTLRYCCCCRRMECWWRSRVVCLHWPAFVCMAAEGVWRWHTGESCQASILISKPWKNRTLLRKWQQTCRFFRAFRFLLSNFKRKRNVHGETVRDYEIILFLVLSQNPTDLEHFKCRFYP